MPKRKSDEDGDFHEDGIYGEFPSYLSQTPDAKKRVRKKSAKVLEMEEADALEKQMFKSSSKSSGHAQQSSAKKQRSKSISGLGPVTGLDSLAQVASAELSAEQNKVNDDNIATSPGSLVTSPVNDPVRDIDTSYENDPEPVTPINIKIKKSKSKKDGKKSHKVKPQVLDDEDQIQSSYSSVPIKQEDSGLKFKFCLKNDLPSPTRDLDFKSDEEQPAIWPSIEQPDQVVVKLKKKKKIKREKFLDFSEFPTIKEEISVPSNVNSETNDQQDVIAPEEGHLVIDTETKPPVKKDKVKTPKKKKKRLIPEPEAKIDNDLDVDVDSVGTEGVDFSDVQPLNLYSNTEAMAMKLKTSSEKKANNREIKPKKEKRFRRRGPTAYTMFSNNYRCKVMAENPGSDFAQVSKRLGEIWQCLPPKEKMVWKRKAKQRVNRLKKMTSQGKPASNDKMPYSDMVYTSKVPTLLKKSNIPMLNKHCSLTKPRKKSQDQSDQEAAAAEAASSTVLGQLLTSHLHEKHSNSTETTVVKPNSNTPCNPIDVAAHLKLLGDSLHTIGSRLKEHRGPIAVQGSLSVLLDSSICAMSSLMCLTNQVPEFQSIPRSLHSETLDNVAYIMPGIG